ncbi:HNH endonuclease [Priestia megaterium]|uniref:HNH endonuclease n=1 Tax=Priestia megaterium TaxID=1404 RepID=UPI002E215036|nr:HNH endonuclease [Priestia megaterium]
MNHVILQPSGGAGRENFENTIRRPVHLSEIIPYLDEKDVSRIQSYYADGFVPIWGVTPGKKNVNFNRWKKIQIGDIALFTVEKKIFASGVVTHKFQSQELAEKLWGWKEEGVTWKNIYLLDEIKEQEIPIQDFNKSVGYTINNFVKGFTILNDEKSNKFFTFFGMESEIYRPDVSEEEFKNVILTIDADKTLDKEILAKMRTEQNFLRRHLFNNKKTGTCGICSKELPVEFLIASHIKKRANCSIEEKQDFRNIVMPMCKFGCDDLYEKGFIGIQEGKVVVLKEHNLTPFVKGYIESIEGENCNHWHAGTINYFNWHIDKHQLSMTK